MRSIYLLLHYLIVFHIFGVCFVFKTMSLLRLRNALNASQSVLDQATSIAKLGELGALRELRTISEKETRRDVTYHVYQSKLEEYKKSPLFASTMATTLVNTFHSSYRASFTDVVEKSSPGNVAVDLFEKANAELHVHHEYEDSTWFPKLKELHPDVSDEFALMEEDHAYIVQLEPAIRAGNYEALIDFVESLNDHLNREELLIVPYLMEGTGGL